MSPRSLSSSGWFCSATCPTCPGFTPSATEMTKTACLLHTWCASMQSLWRLASGESRCSSPLVSKEEACRTPSTWIETLQHTRDNFPKPPLIVYTVSANSDFLLVKANIFFHIQGTVVQAANIWVKTKTRSGRVFLHQGKALLTAKRFLPSAQGLIEQLCSVLMFCISYKIQKANDEFSLQCVS